MDYSKLKYYTKLCEKGVIEKEPENLDGIITLLEEKQFEYLTRLETTKDESRKDEINETLDLLYDSMISNLETLEGHVSEPEINEYIAEMLVAHPEYEDILQSEWYYYHIYEPDRFKFSYCVKDFDGNQLNELIFGLDVDGDGTVDPFMIYVFDFDGDEFRSLLKYELNRDGVPGDLMMITADGYLFVSFHDQMAPHYVSGYMANGFYSVQEAIRLDYIYEGDDTFSGYYHFEDENFTTDIGYYDMESTLLDLFGKYEILPDEWIRI